MRFWRLGRLGHGVVFNLAFGCALAAWALTFAPCAGAQAGAGSTAGARAGSTPGSAGVSGAKASAGDGFEPLGRWAKAVLAGDRTAISQFYVSSSQAYAQTPDGRIPNPGAEESSYWAKFAVNGLTAIDAKILEQTVPQPNSAEVVLRVEMTFGSNRREVVSTGQLWVLQQNVWRIAIVQRGDAEPMVALRLPEPKVPNIHLYPEPGEAQKDLDAAFALAKEDHKRVLVVFGARPVTLRLPRFGHHAAFQRGRGVGGGELSCGSREYRRWRRKRKPGHAISDTAGEGDSESRGAGRGWKRVY